MSDQPSLHPANAKASSSSGFGLSLKGRALRYLAAREHSRMELERKLKPHAESVEQLAQVLDDLAAKDFISEARVVESVINRRSAKFGAARVKHELLGKGLDAELVLEAMNGLKATEVERAREIWRRKFDGPASDAAGRAKQMRFLAARGFSGDTIRKVVSSVEED
jgi:regulatory protein